MFIKAQVLTALLIVSVLFQGIYASDDLGAGRYHSAILHDGKIWTWGSNDFGQLGQGDQLERPAATQITGISDWKMVSLGSLHSVGLTHSGNVYVWGANSYGQLGLNDTQARNSPTQLVIAGNVSKVRAGLHSTFIVLSDGNVMAAGKNNFGQLGLGYEDAFQSSPQNCMMGNVIELSSGADHAIFIKGDGTLWGVGNGKYGQLGAAFISGNTSTPVQLGSANDWVDVSSGAFHSIALNSNKELKGWGKNNHGQLSGINQPQILPLIIQSTASSASAGINSSVLLLEDGSLHGYGDNSLGQLTFSVLKSHLTVSIGAGAVWDEVATGAFHSLARTAGGNIFAWGDNRKHQIDGTDSGIIINPTYVFGVPLTAYLNSLSLQIVGDSAALSANSITNPLNGALTYTWSIISAPMGSSAMISNGSSASSNLTFDLDGDYTVQLLVGDGTNTDTDTTTITVDKSKYGSFVWGTNLWSQP